MKGTMRPEEILETVSCYLGEGGDIKEAETENLVNYLKQTSHEPVVQCTFMNIIRATTKHVVLSKFLVAGGWGVLHNWLVKYNDESNSSLLYELLQVYRVLPVDTALLRANDAAKLIKSLRRSPDEKIKVVAEETINKWMQLVREHTKASSKSGTSSGGKVGKKDKLAADAAEPSPRSAVTGGGSGKAGSSSPSSETSDAIGENVSNISATSAQETRERAKTVKLVNSKFRSTGLEETVAKPVSKRSVAAAGAQSRAPPAALAVAGIKRPVPLSQDNAGSEKKAKLLPIASADADVLRNRVLPQKPKSLFESTGFMDALTVPVAPTIKKKRKLSLNSQPGQAKPEVSVPSSPPVPTGTSVTVPTSPPAMAAPPSFYRDTLESPTTGGSAAQADDASSASDEQRSAAAAGRLSPTAGDEPSASETSSVAGGETSQSQANGTGNGRKRKQVTWAADNLLKEIFYFDLDETERVNVNRLKAEGQSTFDEMKKMEIRRDREVFMQGHAIGHISTGRESVIIKMEWFSPPPVDELPPSRIEPGERSIEKLVQERRESKSLQALYFQKEKIPPSAEEVDPRANEIAEPSLRLVPVMIPLDQAEMVVDEIAEPMDTSVAPSLLNVTLPDNLLALLAVARGSQPMENGTAQPPINIDQRAHNSLVTPGILPTPQPASAFEPYYSDNGVAMPDHDVGLLGSGGLLGTGGLLGAGSLLGAGGLLGNGSLLGVGGPSGPMNGPMNGPVSQPNGLFRPSRVVEGSMNSPLLPSPPQMDHDPMIGHPQGPGGRGPRFQGMPPPPPRMMHHNGMLRGPGPGPLMHGAPPGGFRVQGGKPVVCRHFVKGSCRYGLSCQFFHPGVHN